MVACKSIHPQSIRLEGWVGGWVGMGLKIKLIVLGVWLALQGHWYFITCWYMKESLAVMGAQAGLAEIPVPGG